MTLSSWMKTPYATYATDQIRNILILILERQIIMITKSWGFIVFSLQWFCFQVSDIYLVDNLCRLISYMPQGCPLFPYLETQP